MKHLLVVYHSQSGRTRQLVTALCHGAAALEEEVELRCLHAADAGLDALLWADALVIASPENFGTLSGLVWDFFNRSYYPAEGRTVGKAWALLISAGNDGRGAVQAAQRIALGYGWRQTAEPVIVRGEITPEGLAEAKALGELMAAQLSLQS
jgi:multimeric flavodoxin WrbA